MSEPTGAPSAPAAAAASSAVPAVAAPPASNPLLSTPPSRFADAPAAAMAEITSTSEMQVDAEAAEAAAAQAAAPSARSTAMLAPVDSIPTHSIAAESIMATAVAATPSALPSNASAVAGEVPAAAAAAPASAAFPAAASNPDPVSLSLPGPPLGVPLARLLRARFYTGDVQYRCRWVGLHTETWLPRSSLFWRGEDALRQLHEFEDAVTRGFITAEGGWEQFDQMLEWVRGAIPVSTAHNGAAATSAAAAAATAAVTTPGPSALKASRAKPRNPTAAARPASASRGRGRGGAAARRGRGGARAASASQRGRGATAAATRKRKRSNRSPALDSILSDDAELTSAPDTDEAAAGQHDSDFDSSSSSSSSSSAASAPPSARELALFAAAAARGEYEVERLLGDVWEGGLHWYRVKWAGFDEFENSWQRPDDLAGCQALMDKYWRRKERTQRRVERRQQAERKAQREQRKKAKGSAAAGPNHSRPASVRKAASVSAMFAAPSHPRSVAPPPASSSSSSSFYEGALSAFPLRTFATLQDAQRDEDDTPHTDDEAAADTEGRHSSRESAGGAVSAVAAEPSSHSVADLAGAAVSAPFAPPPAPLSLPSDYESDVAGVPALPPSPSSSSTASELLCHPAHKHRADRPEAVLAHDWYDAPHDRHTWLMLIKWKHKPVAECSWEPVDCSFLRGANGMRAAPLNAYLARLTDARIRNCIRKNMAP